jgi:hypothetical protein
MIMLASSEKGCGQMSRCRLITPEGSMRSQKSERNAIEMNQYHDLTHGWSRGSSWQSLTDNREEIAWRSVLSSTIP